MRRVNMVPERLNGHKVINSAPRPGDPNSFIVLVEKKTEYVVATWNENCGSEWVWGHYSPWGAALGTDKNAAYRDAWARFAQKTGGRAAA